ncbi:maleylpyruvate isomerase family mycothiol-dependent enzyme [Marinactinospora rubrisoli]|uniref:Maleylpyruvate isomerase family mycothiol-dependent enzyme n=1 Tax=Marinactinospora rubrisoli TaxID=2715399 RepID=A0ABW2KNB1_9ACTN
MQITDFIATLTIEGRLFADTAQQADPDAPVPGCPAWRVRDLVKHLSSVHRWATGFVAEGGTERVPLPEAPGLRDEELVPWMRAGHERLVAALEAAPADLACWSFLPAPSPLAFWARRQALETTVHRVDAESALGAAISPLRPDLAAEGIAELLTGFHARGRSPVRTETPATLRVRATDVPEAAWNVHLSDGPLRAERAVQEPPAPDCTYEGTAADLYLVLWNRLPLDRVRITGDVGLAHRWRELTNV